MNHKISNKHPSKKPTICFARFALVVIVTLSLTVTGSLRILQTPVVIKVAAKAGAETAVITYREIPLETRIRTTNYGRYSSVCPISDFIDPNGVYTIAYANDKTVFLSHINDKLEITDTITIKKPMPKIGGVCCDQRGNFYIACGQEDEKGVLGSMVTVAVYKYSPSGKLLGKCEDDYRYRTYKNVLGEIMLEDDYETARVPFKSGNCAMAFRGDLLICSYAREMYNTHQSNGVFCVDTTTMKETTDYDSYVSHSFHQAVLVTSGQAPQAKEGTVIFADHGDGFPRGMSIHIMQEPDPREVDDLFPKMVEAVPFHFYGEDGDNTTNAKLTGIGELDKGIVLVGSSAKSMTAAAYEENQQLFLQLLDAATGKPLLSAASRFGTSIEFNTQDFYTDEGIIWLTNNKNKRVMNSAMAVIDTDKVLVMWEEQDKNNRFVNSYYSIVRSDGKVLKKAIPMQNAHVNGTEELKYHDGYVTWTYASSDNLGNNATVYRLDVNKTTTDNMLNAMVTLDEDLIYEGAVNYTGKEIRPSVTVTYEGKKLKKDKDYTISYSNNKKIGVAKVKIKGKGAYKGTLVKEFQITPPEVKNLSGKYSGGKMKLSWKKPKGADGYEILVIDDVFQVPSAQYHDSVKTAIKQTTKTSYSEKLSKSKNRTYYVRPYADIKGRRIYGQWMGPVLSIELK